MDVCMQYKFRIMSISYPQKYTIEVPTHKTVTIKPPTHNTNTHTTFYINQYKSVQNIINDQLSLMNLKHFNINKTIYTYCVNLHT